MSNKRRELLYPTDKIVRKIKTTEMIDGTRLVIEFISGFEKFNTRPYHNYETWGQGWRITDPEYDIIVEKEDLDDAVGEWWTKVEEKRSEDEQVPRQQ